MNSFHILICVLASLLVEGLSMATERSVFAGYTLVSREAIIHQSDQVHVGFIDPLRENFSLRYEYGYARSMNHMSANKRLSLEVHNLMVAGQHEIFERTHIWGGVNLGLVEGTLREKWDSSVSTFHATERKIFAETGFGSTWKLSDHQAFGIDWLLITLPLQRQTQVKNEAEIVALKGPYYSLSEEVEKTYERISSIRSLRVQMSWMF